MRYIFNRFIAASAFQVSSIKYLAKPISTFHQINAYEEDGFLIIDLCASDDGQAIANYNIQNLRKSGEALDEVTCPNKMLKSCKLNNQFVRKTQPISTISNLTSCMITTPSKMMTTLS